MRIILASQSPRRAELLRSHGFSFEVLPPDDKVEESANKDLPPDRLVTELARLKAQYVVGRIADGSKGVANDGTDDGTDDGAPPHRQTVVLAADTVAHCHNQILGKPDSRDDAERMLRLMNGQVHSVLTGVCLWDVSSDRHHEHLEVTSLRMDRLSESQLQSYLASSDWEGKAGAFGYQDGLDWVHIESGLASNVVGLPVEKIKEWIQQLHKSPTI